MPTNLAQMFARYNAWANLRLFEAAATLSHGEFAADRGVFFGGMKGTLNHLLATDRIWMRRFTGTGDAPTRLDAVLFEDLEGLTGARRDEDDRIIAFVGGLDEAALAASFTYSPITNPSPITQPLAPALFHLFNHQTHHRGQAHAILTGFGRPAPSLDMILFQRQSGIGMA